jgi:Protein of unknown function (DUF3105)
VPTRKEERERLRAEREAAERQAQQETRRRLTVGYVVAGVLGLALVVGVGAALFAGDGGGAGTACGEAHIELMSGGSTHGTEPDCREGTPPPAVEQGDLQEAAEAANCDLQLDLPEEGDTHITERSQIPDYRTNPPTSGDHNLIWQLDGAYSEMPEPWYFVHALEHGRIEIQYSPDLPEKDQLALKGVFDESPGGVLLFPNPDMPYEVAATAWTQLMGCKTYEGDATLDAIRDFRETYRDQGPEEVPF